MERTASEERNVRVRIFDPDRGFSRTHSERYCSEREAMVLFWAQAITPNAPMAVQIETLTDPGRDNLHLIRNGLTLKDVPLRLHNDVARWIAEDILEWLAWSCGKEPGPMTGTLEEAVIRRRSSGMPSAKDTGSQRNMTNL